MVVKATAYWGGYKIATIPECRTKHLSQKTCPVLRKTVPSNTYHPKDLTAKSDLLNNKCKVAKPKMTTVFFN